MNVLLDILFQIFGEFLLQAFVVLFLLPGQLALYVCGADIKNGHNGCFAVLVSLVFYTILGWWLWRWLG